MKTTEAASLYNDLENQSTIDLVTWMNQEDQKVAIEVKTKLPIISRFIDQLVPRMRAGGRLFYIGAGTSGRLGILDASECPPTFGVPDDWVVGIMAGGDRAIRNAVENAEDDAEQAWKDLSTYQPDPKTDSVVGIAASGRTPYVLGGVKKASKEGWLTACICCNLDTPIGREVQFPIEMDLGPEFVTGSTRLKSGTAQKLILNLISTVTMIKLGRIKGNRMVDMQLSNEKLRMRGIKMIREFSGLSEEEATQLLLKYGSVREVLHILKAM